ncbi:type VII secretion integral membrane protein EccD [Mycolicibacterium goodii]|uniref:type VII secretion integral membrane protein EccD n=1 Tax=Mycolicibacterium goodii TaxID=134601 RepID=UPI001BDD6F48|nr:type VII secretion integral membrane protein EccD [Mycolicibacterium goodii]MBU8841279.1 type VII secretion integral membrane protein EccD [Mycolicibacterium goodii]
MSPTEPAAPALCRVALLVGEDFEIDYSLPAGVALIAVTEDLVARVNEVLGERGRPLLDAEQSYRLCRADAQPLDPQKTLDECGVLDGEQLWLLPAASAETYEPVTEMVSTAIARAANELLATMTPDVGRRVASWLTAGVVGWACLILVNWWWSSGGTDAPYGWVGAASAWAMLVALVAAARGLSKADASTAAGRERCAAGHALSWVALLPAAAAAAMSLPGTPGLWHVAAPLVAVIVGVIVLGAIWGRHIVAIAAILTVSVFALPACVVAASTWEVRPERVAVVALIGVIVLVTWASSTAVAASGVPTPLFPSVTNRGVFERLPGQPADTVSPVGPTGVATAEQVRNWLLRGNNTLTGLMVGLAVVTVVAARYAVVPGQPGGWYYTAFVAAVAVILVLRSRSFVDRYQSVTLLIAGVGAAAVTIGRYAANDSTSLTVALVCVAVTIGLAVFGLLTALVVPFREYTAPIRRFVEFIDYALVLALGPWATIFLLDLWPVIRNAVRHGI